MKSFQKLEVWKCCRSLRKGISDLTNSNILLLLTFWVAIELFSIKLGFQNINAQEFEGKIIYKVSYEPKPGKSEYLKSLKKATYRELYYKEGKLKFFSDATFPEIIYLPSTNTLYYINNDGKVASTHNCFEEKRKLLYEENLPEEIILNKKCIGNLTAMGNDKHINYFDTSLYINPLHFKDYNATHLNKVFEKFKSFPLKYIYKTDKYIYTETATSVQPMFISDSVFFVPDSIPDFTKNTSAPRPSSLFELNYNLGLKALENKNYDEAIRYFNKAFPGDPKNIDLLFNRALAKYYADDKNGACKDWSKAKSYGDIESEKLYEKYCQ